MSGMPSSVEKQYNLLLPFPIVLQSNFRKDIGEDRSIALFQFSPHINNVGQRASFYQEHGRAN